MRGEKRKREEKRRGKEREIRRRWYGEQSQINGRISAEVTGGFQGLTT